ncbi:kinase-like domain-containing protein [Aspergillus cavernicola]|uniref:Kinase-like domain-containing protein n=1 Tax=Aspergillus cavernicola TaxID=176166 RepID=A0ABR4HZT9_9EURO
MSHSIHVLWFDLFHQKKADLLHHIPPTFLEDIPSTYTVDSSLRISFENFCREIREREYPRLLARLRYDRVDVFARTIDRALQYKPPINFAGLISAALFITIQCGYQARVVLSDVIDLLNKLDRAVPSLGDDVSPDAPQILVDGYMYQCAATDLISEVQNRIREAKAALKQGRKALECDFSQSYTPEHQREQSLFSDSTGTWRLDRQELLGRGAFGEVYKVVERSTGQVYALKQIPLGSDPERQRVIEEKVQNECKTMRKLPHLHIINVSFFYPEVECWNIIMDVVADSNLRQFLHYCCSGEYRDPETFSVMLPWFGCLVDALNFAHRCKVIHNDIKPSNILIKGDTVYLADFGLSSDFTAQDSSRGLEYIQYGTPEYKAPEMSLGAHPSRMADSEVSGQFSKVPVSS